MRADAEGAQIISGCFLLRVILGHADLTQACRLLVPS